jgi:transcriptional regulator with PAS, ATPase and Fis domain
LTICQKTGQPQIGKRINLPQASIVVNRKPIVVGNKIAGVISVFQDISEYEKMITELQGFKELHAKLEAVIASSHDGLVEAGNGGTVFLDEVTEISLNLQVKLLEIIEEKSFTRVGGIRSKSVDVRIIAASNRDLKQMIQQGEFREDLYFRLNVFPINIPPLYRRPEDITALANHFLVCTFIAFSLM